MSLCRAPIVLIIVLNIECITNHTVFLNIHSLTRTPVHPKQNTDDSTPAWATSNDTTTKDSSPIRDKSPARPSPGKLKNLSMFESNNQDTDVAYSKVTSSRDKSPFRDVTASGGGGGLKNKLQMFESKPEEQSFALTSQSRHQNKPIGAYHSDLTRHNDINRHHETPTNISHQYQHKQNASPFNKHVDSTHKSVTSRTVVGSGYHDNAHVDNLTWKEKLKDNAERNARDAAKFSMSHEEPKVECSQ